ncbi:fungal-specific transcription factor domain-containing protein [Xylariaceae sp. FL1272]|nr:fungal-specific transcription factor domain-containing protein [Xylariaceae sp. FL1272]
MNQTLRDRLNQLENQLVTLRFDLDAKDAQIQPAETLPRQCLNDLGPAGISTNIGPASNAAPTENDDLVDDRSDCGSLVVSTSKLRYVGQEHWAAILDSIADLKSQVSSEDLSPEEVASDNANKKSDRALLLYGREPASRAEILQALPPKPIVDRHVSRYFNYVDLVSFTIHGPSFLCEYEAFWKDPYTVSFAWVGLLFGMICLAAIVSETFNPEYRAESSQQDHIQVYREKVVECLVAAEYTKPGEHVLEAMIQYIYLEFLLGPDAKEDLWFLLGLEVNMALRMGYHRDPSHFPNITPFKSEMRRRIWSAVRFGDVLISSQMGMPRMISESCCDAAEPHNLNDSDLHYDMTELPPTRPETETTTVLGVIARRRMVNVLAIIADLTGSAKPYSHAEVMRVDKMLHESEDSIPPPLKPKSSAASITDPPIIIVGRQIMLHRKFLYARTSVELSEDYAYSGNACLEASLNLLQIQHILDEETLPGGQLDTLRWRMTSIMNHQFLTATMILCSLIYYGKTQYRSDDILSALRTARNIWMRRSGSAEATKATETINAIFARAIKEGRNDTMAGQDGFGAFHMDNLEADSTLTALYHGDIDPSHFMLQGFDDGIVEFNDHSIQPTFTMDDYSTFEQAQNLAHGHNSWGND